MSHSSQKAWFLGPKAENEFVFEQMLLESWRDYCYWRRNFHPEDMPYVGVKDKLSPEFQEYVASLHQHLFEMLSHLKRSTPSFSPRYLGHMMSDLLIPGVLGSISAMLYNQNNITEEAATITLQFEEEAMGLLAFMLGLPADTAWGHLCSGGTLANIEALWIARNLCLWPWQMAITLKEYPHSPLQMLVTQAQWEHPSTISKTEILNFQSQLAAMLEADDSWWEAFKANSLSHLGWVRFSKKCLEQLGQEPHLYVAMSHNAHYSLGKALDLLGLGQANLLAVPLNAKMQMDLTVLAEWLTSDRLKNGQLMAVIGVYGSTEEGAIDDFPEIHRLRQEWRQSQRGDFWIHADACYGGYALSMLHPHTNAAGLQQHFAERLQHIQLEQPSTNHLLWSRQQCENWIQVSQAIGSADSVSIDPHKMGYIPYPAGAVLYHDYRVREFIRCDAPYINATSTDPQEPPRNQWRMPYLGRYTLEGSRPGATGAALWLAHKTVPLDLNGHGAIVSHSILGARYLQQVLTEQIRYTQDEFQLSCRFLCEEPDLNILCYTFPSQLRGQAIPLMVLNHCIRRIYEECLATENHPTATRQFVVAMTKLAATTYAPTLLNQIVSNLGIGGGQILPTGLLPHQGNPWRDDDHLALIRTVIMGPFLLEAQTRPRLQGQPINLAVQFAELLQQTLPKVLLELLNEPLPTHKKPKLESKVLILEPDLDNLGLLTEQLHGGSFIPTQADLVFTARDPEQAMNLALNHEIKAVLVAAHLGGEQQSDTQAFLKHMALLPTFKGAVVLTSGSPQPEPHCQTELTAAKIYYREKSTRMNRLRQMSLNQIMADLRDILLL